MSDQWTLGSGDQGPVDDADVTSPVTGPVTAPVTPPTAPVPEWEPAPEPVQPPAQHPAPEPVPDAAPEPRRWPGVRVRTVVFGVILLVIAVGNATPVWLDVDVDAPVAAVALLGGLGLAMVLGAASAGRRQRS